MLKRRHLRREDDFLSEKVSTLWRAAARVDATMGWASRAVLGDGDDIISGKFVVVNVVQVTLGREC